MTIARELLREARDFIGELERSDDGRRLWRAIDAFLAQPEPETVAWMALVDGVAVQTAISRDQLAQSYSHVVPLYAAQPEPAAPIPTLDMHGHNAAWWKAKADAPVMKRLPADMEKIIADNMSKLYDDTKPEPSAEVDKIMELADTWAADESSLKEESSTRAALRAEVERLARERDNFQCDAGIARVQRDEQVTVNKLLKERAEAAERDAKRYRRIRENWIDCAELNLHGRLSVVDEAADAAIAQEKP